MGLEGFFIWGAMFIWVWGRVERLKMTPDPGGGEGLPNATKFSGGGGGEGVGGKREAPYLPAPPRLTSFRFLGLVNTSKTGPGSSLWDWRQFSSIVGEV